MAYTHGMLVQLDQLKGLAVASLREEAKVGTVADVVVHPETGELVGFWVHLPGLFGAKKALSARDVVSYDPQAIVVADDDAIVEPTEIHPFQAVVAKPHTWLGKRVETEDGRSLGRVSNLYLNTDLEMLAKLVVSGGLFGRDRVLPREAIVRVTKAKIVVSVTEGETAPDPEPATAREAVA